MLLVRFAELLTYIKSSVAPGLSLSLNRVVDNLCAADRTGVDAMMLEGVPMLQAIVKENQ